MKFSCFKLNLLDVMTFASVNLLQQHIHEQN